jgi:hypothetical protein
MAIQVRPVNIPQERWMRMPGLTSSAGPLGDLFVCSGFADFTGGPEALIGTGEVNTDDQAKWVEYDIIEMRVGPRWLRVRGVCPTVVIGGHSQVSPDEANAMGFKIQRVTNIALVSRVEPPESGTLVSRIELGVNVVVRGGLDGQILTLAYQVTAWGTLASPMGTLVQLAPPMFKEGIFFAGGDILT